MAQPQAYEREHDFVNDDEIDKSKLNTEFDNAAQSINDLRDNLALIQNDDGSLRDGIVHENNLDDDVFDRFQEEMQEATADAQKYADAAVIYQKIKDSYPKYLMAYRVNIDKYIDRANFLANQK